MINLQIGLDPEDFRDLNLLIVDGRPRSGASVAAVIDELHRIGARPRSIKSAALFAQRSIRHFEFDYVGLEVQDARLLDEPPWRLADRDYVNDYAPPHELLDRPLD